jgi:hypothetical protein
MLDELDLVDVDNLTLDQLEQVRQELLNGNALVAALRLTYLIRDRLDGDYLAQVAKNVETHTHLQNLIDAQLAAVDASPAHHPETGTDGGIV